VCQHIGSLDYLGFDVIITQDCLVFCEINSHPAMDYEQVMCAPALSEPSIRAFFEKQGLFKVDYNAFWQMYQKSQV